MNFKKEEKQLIIMAIPNYEIFLNTIHENFTDLRTICHVQLTLENLPRDNSPQPSRHCTTCCGIIQHCINNFMVTFIDVFYQNYCNSCISGLALLLAMVPLKLTFILLFIELSCGQLSHVLAMKSCPILKFS